MNEINLIRGDTEAIELRFVKDGAEYVPSGIDDGDIFTFTIRDMITEKPILVKKAIMPNKRIELVHEETKGLEAKKYNYDIEYRKPDKSIVKTLVIGKINIIKDVTYDDRD